MSIKEKISQFFQHAAQPSDIGFAVGMYPCSHEHNGEVTRIHLRVDESG